MCCSGDLDTCLANLTKMISQAADIAVPKKKATPHIAKYWIVTDM